MQANALGKKRHIWTSRGRESVSAYLMMAPAVFTLFLFLYFPLLFSLYVSLQDWNVIGTMKWVGLSNYAEMFGDATFLQAMKKTALYAVIYAPGLFCISLGLSLLVKHLRKASGFFRTTFFAPIVLSSIASGMIWKLIFNEKRGAFSMLVKLFGGKPQPWLGQDETAFMAALIVHIWLQMGYYMIIFLAGLQDIPGDYYEAGRLDGANAVQLFWHITIPGLANTSLFVLIMSFIISLQAYDQIVLLTAGGPNGATRLAVQEIYETAFQLNRMGYASAKSFLLFFGILLVTILQLRATRSNKQ